MQQQHYYTPMTQLVQRFDDAVLWLREFGVRFEGVRMQAIRSDVAMVGALPPGHQMPREDVAPRVLASLTDAADLVRIHKFYRGRESALLLERLNGVARGPLPDQPEGDGSTKARDVLAELSWGAMLEGSGYPTRLDADPDVVEDYPLIPKPFTIVYEVKRPKSASQIGNRVKEGRVQVQAAIRGHDAHGRKVHSGPHMVGWGCVVVVLDNLLPRRPEELQRVVDEREGSQFLYDTVERWRQENETALNKAARPGVAGCWIWWRAHGQLLRPNGRFQPTEFHQVTPIVYPTASEDARVLLESRKGKIQAKSL